MNTTAMSERLPTIDHYLVGIGNSPDPSLPKEVLSIIEKCRVFSGGGRHYRLIAHLLPEGHEWIPIKGKMEELIRAYGKQGSPIVTFVSGDPFFYGFGNTLRRHAPEAGIEVFPYFNCLQLLCHRLQCSYERIRPVSVHGRNWEELDQALMSGERQIGVLTDQDKSPAAIARRMLDYGFHHYTMTIGEELEATTEKISTLTLEEAAEYKSVALNCLLLSSGCSHRPALGIPDEAWAHLPGRPGMMTKRPVRLTTLSLLRLHQASAFWDVGSCTGSIAIEARRMFPGLAVTAFEKRPECEAIIMENQRKHHAPGIQIHIGDVFEKDLSGKGRPEAIFIGGHGNRLGEMVRLMDRYLLPGGMLAMNTVKPASKAQFLRTCREQGYRVQEPIEMTVNEFNPISILAAIKPTA